MNSGRSNNLTLLRRFLIWLIEADGKSLSTQKKYLYEITKLVDFMGIRSLKKLTPEIIIGFKKWLKASGISIASYCTSLRILKKFLAWLMSQPGYKSRITSSLIQYMSPTAEESRIAQLPAIRNIMPLEWVIKLHNSIPDDNPIGMRDRAAIGLEITTGIRHKALITLPRSCLYLEDGYIHQDPLRNVDTKFKKSIFSAICDVDGLFLKSIKKWDEYQRENGFGENDPFICKAKKKKDPVSDCYVSSDDVIPEFWKSHTSLTEVIRKRCEEAGLRYYSPHTFRHLLVKLVQELDLSRKESKCFSQSLGHEHEDTTYGCYGKFTNDEVLSVVSKIDFSNTSRKSDIDYDELEELREFKRWKKMKNILNKEHENDR